MEPLHLMPAGHTEQSSGQTGSEGNETSCSLQTAAL